MKIVLDCSIHELPEEEQDELFEMAHDHDVFCTDDNGVLWQILDLREIAKEIA